MSHGSDLAYSYDGSFDGFLCCVFESYEKREMPLWIQSENVNKGLIFDTKWVDTDASKAERVYGSIKDRISAEARELMDLSFLTCLPDKEVLMLRFLRMGFKIGGKVMSLVTDDTVYQLQRAVRHMTSEAHKLKGFLRFSVCEGVLVSVIEPKNHVLPILEPHFCDRYSGEAFVIFDGSHKSALIYRPTESTIIDVEEFEIPKADARESEFRRLWKQFYDTIAIEGRYNPKCRMSHMPKRYWANMTELNGSAITDKSASIRKLIEKE